MIVKSTFYPYCIPTNRVNKNQ